MKNYEEMAKLVLEARDEYIKKKMKRTLYLKKVSAIAIGAVAVIGIFVFTNGMRSPERPTNKEQGIITETVDTSNSTVISTETTFRTVQSVQSTSTFLNNTENKKTVTTIAEITDINTQNVVNATLSSRQSIENTGNNTMQTTILTEITTNYQFPQTSQIVTTKNNSTTSVSEFYTSTSQLINTSSCAETTTVITNTTPVYSEWLGAYYEENKSTYRAAWKNSQKISVTNDNIDKYLGKKELSLTYDMSTYVDELCKIYSVKNFSPNYVLAIQSNDDTTPKICCTGAKFKTLGELIEGTNLSNTLVLKEAYKGFIEPDSIPLGTPELTSLMDVFSDKSLESLDSSVYGNTRLYTIKAEIPELGKDGRIIIAKDILDPEAGYISLEILGKKCTYNVGAEKIDKFISSFINKENN